MTPLAVHAQRPPETAAESQAAGRRAAGLRVGFWSVDVAPGGDASRSPHFMLFLQRGLNPHLALENSVAVWWVTSTTTQALPDAPEVTTRSYVVPLLASLKLYPLTSAADRFEPFVMGGVGIAFGIEDQGENAIGGGGTTIVTGLGFRGGMGAEFHVTSAFGVSASGKYQWAHFGEDIGTSDTFNGVGAEGGIIYRFQF